MQRWYGYQAMLTDAAAVGLMVGAIAALEPLFSGAKNNTTEVLATASLGVFVVGAPTIHAAHGHWGKAGLSLGIRAAPVVLGSLLGHAGEWISGGGMIAAMIIDYAFIAHEQVPKESSGWYLVPYVGAGSHAANMVMGASAGRMF